VVVYRVLTLNENDVVIGRVDGNRQKRIVDSWTVSVSRRRRRAAIGQGQGPATASQQIDTHGLLDLLFPRARHALNHSVEDEERLEKVTCEVPSFLYRVLRNGNLLTSLRLSDKL
jgi:hypothetical protein